MGKLIAGVQLYTLRDFCKSVSDTANTLKKVKEIGYNVVQVSGVSEPEDVKEMKKIIDDNGLVACSHIQGTKEL